jgi:hypothetical protein
MYVCTYVCMYVCMYVCTYVRMYILMYVRMYVCMYVRMYVLPMYVHSDVLKNGCVQFSFHSLERREVTVFGERATMAAASCLRIPS